LEPVTQGKHQSFLRTLYYWALLFVTLLIVDDASFGWVFWGISQYSLAVSAVTALVVYWSLGYMITIRGLTPNPGKWAGWFLNRLQLGHGNMELRSRKSRLQGKVTSIAAAIPMTLLFGGVLTTLWLRRQKVVDDHQARVLGFWLCGLFALEVAAIHALGIGGLILYVRHLW
jgi:hypothetical protein